MSERLPSVHRSRAVVARGPLAWLADRLVPSGALRWGRLTVERRRWRSAMAECEWRASRARQTAAFERLARTMDAPGKRTADAFVPAQFDGWWQP